MTTAAQAGDDGVVTITDPRAIRALAHPARLAVIDRLFTGEVLTATECARIAGLTPSAMSYHLRALERWGLVARADAAPDGRERPWRATGTTVRVSSAEAGGVVAEQVLLEQSVEHLRTKLLAALARRRVAPESDREALAFSRGSARLSKADFLALTEEVEAVIDRYSRRPADPEGLRYHLWFAGMADDPGEVDA